MQKFLKNTSSRYAQERLAESLTLLVHGGKSLAAHLFSLGLLLSSVLTLFPFLFLLLLPFAFLLFLSLFSVFGHSGLFLCSHCHILCVLCNSGIDFLFNASLIYNQRTA